MNPTSTRSLKLSLRGSLASRYIQFASTGSPADAAELVRGLLTSSDPNVIAFVAEDRLIVGLLSERGSCLPDW